uniref:Uncharacterized protein n=1 Tax=Rhizophora mucronata TaxID=61149 RepID=A0A2P2QUQ7_RHIMU
MVKLSPFAHNDKGRSSNSKLFLGASEPLGMRGSSDRKELDLKDGCWSKAN